MWEKTNNLDVPIWDFKKDREIEGEYVVKKTEVGANKSNIYRLKKKNGDLIEFWGSTVIDSQMSDKSIGDYIRVTYIGQSKGKRGTYNNFSVDRWIDASELPRAKENKEEENTLDPDTIIFE